MRPTSTRRPRHSVVPRVAFSVLLLSLTVGLLSGCVASTAAPPVVTQPTTPALAPPVFASNDEALAAAKAAYTKYLSLGDSVGPTGSASWKEYLSLTTGTEHEGAVEARKLMDERGWSFTGVTLFDTMTVQSSQELPDSTWEIRTYLCLDLSATGTVNDAGESVVKSDRPQREPMVVVFVTPDKNTQQLLISESPIWSGSNFCS